MPSKAKQEEETSIMLDLSMAEGSDAVDIWDYDDTPKPVVPEGEYLAALTSWEHKFNEEKGSLGVMWSWVLLNGPAAGKELPYVYTYIGKAEYDNGKLSIKDAKNGGNFRAAMAAAGLDPASSPELYRNRQFAANAEDIVGRMVYLTVKHEPNEYRGVKSLRANVKYYRPFEVKGQKYDPETVEVPVAESDESTIEAF